MGPIMLDVSGYEISPEEKDILDHPLVGGIILFSRNYHDQKQLKELVSELRKNARNDLLIAVDHEGGRVQRFREGFSAIPAMGSFCAADAKISELMLTQANTFGWLMAAELLAFDIDISFAPVLDIHGVSDVIGNRSFHQDPTHIVSLASAFIHGMHSAGMKCTGKHFPGHGNVKEDSHIAMPVDKRSKEQIFQLDMTVFDKLHQQGLLDAVMPAHVIYPAVDALPAGFSPIWVGQILRQQLGFNGVVFTDDLSMQGAVQLGSIVERAQAGLNAGCDMTLVCNSPNDAAQVIDGLPSDYQSTGRVKSMRKGPFPGFSELQKTAKYQMALKTLGQFNES
ncbi:beta-N-acetylhexosaminidase [Aliiglaciecola sp. 2_MG-2023]|uniref:beta-N-acetylhexosaminidase n=2 Tax=Alteromonadaceae TaxID=72275 RepID=UPI0026E3081F|nr:MULTISPECIES: beta-N-acetylhexosaminidase [unclassified Aliiglaciecola]MDO6712314.1 beta-N-acetylhexosaminidase [Aliiglaciecola sp. 2_MG-2023]MDO6753280.1 beta-N-acetylhexosaminidase [Aliiglaciecola sp. 1_MG-2023]